MQFSDPMSDYIKRTTLTDKGDILQEGEILPQRLSIGQDKQILRVNGSTNLLQYYDREPFQEIGFNNLISITSNIPLTTNEITVFTFPDINVLAGDLYTIKTYYDLNINSDANLYFNLTNATGNEVACVINGNTYSSIYSNSLRFLVKAAITTRGLLEWNVKIIDDGIFKPRIRVDINTGTGTLYSGLSKCWYNKINYRE